MVALNPESQTVVSNFFSMINYIGGGTFVIYCMYTHTAFWKFDLSSSISTQVGVEVGSIVEAAVERALRFGDVVLV